MKNFTGIVFIFLMLTTNCGAQLKYLIEDFEGTNEGQTNLAHEGIFAYGSVNLKIDKSLCSGHGYSGLRALKVCWDGKKHFGGWGKGISSFVELNSSTDLLNFYAFIPKSNNTPVKLRLTIDDDDNLNGIKEDDKDDYWRHVITVQPSEYWQLISIPLSDFYDSNPGGDGKFNISYKEGKLLNLSMNFPDSSMINIAECWYFDFFSFSKGKLPVQENILNPVTDSNNNFCLLGAWSDAGYNSDITRIPESFLSDLKATNNKLRIVHFFRPLSYDGGKKPDSYPDLQNINKLLERGYQPMITMEIQYVKVRKTVDQPDLKDIISGKFDHYLRAWAKEIKKANGNIWLRILHEFNGDWYPWCISKNGNNPELFVKAYRHIHDIFKQENATNVKFIWCPNSVSIPKETWNYIMDAYPGDDYVDYAGIDVYNGAEDKYLWRSFRKECIENYFLFSQYLPNKPVIICEVATRERTSSEKGDAESKAQWIEQMSETLKTDMAKIQLISWFNAMEKFKVSSSKESLEAFNRFIWEDGYFKSGR